MTNPRFRTKYEPVRTRTPSGDPIHIEYAGRYDEKGILVLDKVGETNIYNEIQSHADSVDINTIIRRYESGEVDVLNRAQGLFMDVTTAPKTYADMLNLLRRAEEVFDGLPAEIRAQYDNSFEQFFAQNGMEEILLSPTDPEPETKDDEVKPDEP